jgi:hypothetical protein
MSDKPEGNWGWRRFYTFLVSGGLLAVAYAKGMDSAIYITGAIAATYLITPSAQAWLAAITAWRKPV